MITSPTTAEITLVQNNLANMQSLNDWLHDDGQDKIATAFLLFSEGDLEPHNSIILDLFEAAFSILGTITDVGAIVAAAGSALVSVTEDFMQSPPRSIDGTFASFLANFNAVWKAIDFQLSVYHNSDYIKSNWNNQLAPKGSKLNITLRDLAQGKFPCEADETFQIIGDAASVAFTQHLWLTLLKRWNYQFTVSDHLFMHGERDVQPPTPVQFIEDSMASTPTCYYPGAPVWEGQWVANVYTVFGRGGLLNNDSCNYIFKDNPQRGYASKLSNPDGLWYKSQLWALLNPTN